MHQAVEYISESAMATGKELLFVFGPMFLIAGIMNLLSRVVEAKLSNTLGKRLYFMLFAWMGTSVHELGHALFCVLFGHKINEIRFFSPDEDSGTLGYVNHSYNPKSLYQNVGNFFIGVGPIILGAAAIYTASKLLLPTMDQSSVPPPPPGMDQASLREVWRTILNIFRWSNFSEWTFYLFIYLALSVGSSINLSPADLKGATKGFIAIALILFAANLATLWLHLESPESISGFFRGFMSTFYGVMIPTIILNALFAAILTPFARPNAN